MPMPLSCRLWYKDEFTYEEMFNLGLIQWSKTCQRREKSKLFLHPGVNMLISRDFQSLMGSFLGMMMHLAAEQIALKLFFKGDISTEWLGQQKVRIWNPLKIHGGNGGKKKWSMTSRAVTVVTVLKRMNFIFLRDHLRGCWALNCPIYTERKPSKIKPFDLLWLSHFPHFGQTFCLLDAI